MRLAKKQDGMADGIAPENEEVSSESTALVMFTEKSNSPPPAASLSANLISRRSATSAGGVTVDQIDTQAMPDALEVPDEPIGARAQQAILEKAFEEPEPVGFENLEPVETEVLERVDSVSPIERSKYQSARDSAGDWSLRRDNTSGSLERVVRDVSLFTIFFAVWLLAIFQTL